MDSEVVNLVKHLAGADGAGPVWTATSEDLNVNLLRFDAGQGVPRHVNDEVDVLIVGIAGEGRIDVGEMSRAIGPGQICLIPKGTPRAIHSAGGPFAYLTCHRRRSRLWPT